MISVFGSDISALEIKAVSQCLEEQWIGFGPRVDDFEHQFGEKINSDSFLMVDSGSNALYMAMHLLSLPPGSKVIVPSVTWVSCAQAVLLAGHFPLFADVNPETMNIGIEQIQPLLKQRPAAIMVVHYAGLPVDLAPMIDTGLPLIEDAAHAVDSYYHGQHCGTVGDIGIFSFDAVKNLTAGEGGGLTAKDINSFQRARNLRYCGIGKSGFQAASEQTHTGGRWWEYNISEPFIKMLPTSIAASIALAQLQRLPELQAKRKKIWEYYTSELLPFDELILPSDAPIGCRHSYFTYCVRTPGRDSLARYLRSEGIYTTLRYHPLHLNSLYGQQSLSLPNSELINETALSLPLHPRLTDSEIEHVAAATKRWLLAQRA